MMDLFRAFALRQESKRHVLTDEAVMHAVNLGAMIHNLLAAYQEGIESGDFDRFRQKMYDVSVAFHDEDAAEARENMRREWVRRCTVREGV